MNANQNQMAMVGKNVTQLFKKCVEFVGNIEMNLGSGFLVN